VAESIRKAHPTVRMVSWYYHKPFFIIDAAINIAPDLIMKKDILQNAIDLLVGISEQPIVPKVAVLSAVETVSSNPAMQSTVDAACLCKMADRQQIRGAILDRPLAYDNAQESRPHQGYPFTSLRRRRYFSDARSRSWQHAGQAAYPSWQCLCCRHCFGRVPIVLTSRADGVESRIGSCALAVLMADARTALLRTCHSRSCD
jgi:phosphotransacetylase